MGEAAVHNTIAGVLVGVDVTGQSRLANGQSGIRLDSHAADNTLGNDWSFPVNFISGNEKEGVEIIGAHDNLLQGNIIGLSADGSTLLDNRQNGILLSNNSQNNTIGTTGAKVGRNVISGNGQSGVALVGAQTTGNKLVANLIGTNAAGTVKKPNGGDGVRLDLACSNIIGGVENEDEPNVISGNGGNGIKIEGGNNNLVAANKIGTNKLGTAELGNEGNGIYIDGTHNTIGVEATDPMEGTILRNIISGNGKAGVDLAGGTLTWIMNCFIGTDAGGNAPIPNREDGV